MRNSASQQYFPGMARLLLLLFTWFTAQLQNIKSIPCLLLLWDQGSKLRLILTVANAINISLLVTKNSALVANLATAFLCTDGE